MMLAFLVDQVQQLCCPLCQAVWAKLGSKRRLWEKMRSLFAVCPGLPAEPVRSALLRCEEIGFHPRRRFLLSDLLTRSVACPKNRPRFHLQGLSASERNAQLTWHQAWRLGELPSRCKPGSDGDKLRRNTSVDITRIGNTGDRRELLIVQQARVLQTLRIHIAIPQSSRLSKAI